MTRPGPAPGILTGVRRLGPVLVVACAAMLAGCGGSSDKGDQARTQTAAPELAPAPRTPLELPQGIPLTATGPADPAGARVVRAWSKALREGDIAAATALWAVPSKVQNGTPVLTLSTRELVRLFNVSLPCGSVVTSTGAAGGGFTITTFRLTQRKGSRCDATAGATARGAIRVRNGKIVEWYRLPDEPGPRTDDVDSTTI
jgi:limonene-1,2-epoxide hydrolase